MNRLPTADLKPLKDFGPSSEPIYANRVCISMRLRTLQSLAEKVNSPRERARGRIKRADIIKGR